MLLEEGVVAVAIMAGAAPKILLLARMQLLVDDMVITVPAMHWLLLAKHCEDGKSIWLPDSYAE